MGLWRAGCSETGTSGSEGGPGKRTRTKAWHRAPARPNTEHPTAEGKVYCCAIKDLFSNRIVGYSLEDRMTAQRAVTALPTAVARRRPAGLVVVHSDRGSQRGFNWSSQH